MKPGPVLSLCPALSDIISAHTKPLAGSSDPGQKKHLQTLMCSIIQQKDVRLCFLIDGLDEYGDGKPAANRNIMKMVSSFLSLSKEAGNLKCCVSSRQLQAFESSLCEVPRLTMQTVNERDIAGYIDRELSPVADAGMKTELLHKARGVRDTTLF